MLEIKLRNLLSRYIAAYPAQRLRPVGAPESPTRKDQDDRIKLEYEAAQAIACSIELDQGPDLTKRVVIAQKKPMILKAYKHLPSTRKVADIFDVSHETVANIVLNSKREAGE